MIWKQKSNTECARWYIELCCANQKLLTDKLLAKPTKKTVEDRAEKPAKIIWELQKYLPPTTVTRDIEYFEKNVCNVQRKRILTLARNKS